jgi:hypothetical protein
VKIRRSAMAYLLLCGIGINIVGAALLIYGTQQALALGLPLPTLANKILLKIEEESPKFSWVLSHHFGIKSQAYQSTLTSLANIDPQHFAHDDLARQIITYGETGKPLSSLASSAGDELAASGTPKRTVAVATTKQLLDAIKASRAGDVIMVEPGEYLITQRSVSVTSAGEPNAPIVVRGRTRQGVLIRLNALEGFHVKAPFWRFENLTIEGVCANHDACEHAFHVVGNGRSVVIRDNSIKNFNAAIKVNGAGAGNERTYPDAGLIQNNSIFNTAARKTGNPVTPIDIVAADDWVVRGNLIADFIKGRGDRISYAAFIKGNSEQGLFERNLVICEMNVIGEGIRLGLSLGGGGTAKAACRAGDCSTEHSRGTIRNNIIMRCPHDVGIYLNRAAATEIYNNTMLRTLGIDVRFSTSNATIANNILSGRILNRDHGYNEQLRNLVSSMSPWFWEARPQDWFVDPDGGDLTLRSTRDVLGKGVGVVDGVVDFCGHDRPQNSTDLGAIEYSSAFSCEPLKLFEHSPKALK